MSLNETYSLFVKEFWVTSINIVTANINYEIVKLSLCLFLILFTVIINCLILIVFIASPKLRRHITNWIFVSMALSNLLVGIFVMNFMSIYTIWQKWPLGVGACIFWSTLDFSSCTISNMHLVWIAYIRYHYMTLYKNKNDKKDRSFPRNIYKKFQGLFIRENIVMENQQKFSMTTTTTTTTRKSCQVKNNSSNQITKKNKATNRLINSFFKKSICSSKILTNNNLFIFLLIWCIPVCFWATFISLVLLFYAPLEPGTCFFTYKLPYVLLGDFLGFILPIIALTTYNALLVSQLRMKSKLTAYMTSERTTNDIDSSTNTQGTHPSKRQNLTKKDRKAISQLFIISIIFIAFWLSFILVWPINRICGCISDHFYLTSYWLAYIHSAVHPLILLLTHNSFRQFLKSGCSDKT
ncbi:hypothetical protein SNEBB_006536 [Seison nebaliae]|nr:hypothetical protein SNEBB_006536 [Seison nebaliae]